MSIRMLLLAFLISLTLASVDYYEFALGEANSISCPDGYDVITDVNRCLNEADDALNMGIFVGNLNHDDRPQGCFKTWSGDFGFNNHDNPTSASWNQIVCQRLAPYILTSESTCPESSKAFGSGSECEDIFGDLYVGEINTFNLPKGCSFSSSTNHATFNLHFAGNDNEQYQLACIPLTGNPTQAPTSSEPTFAPTTSKPTNLPSFAPTTSKPTFAPTTSKPTNLPSFAPTTSKPTFAPTTSIPTFAPATSGPTFSPTDAPSTSKPTLFPTTSEPTESPTWPNGYISEHVLCENNFDELLELFDGLEEFLAQCTSAADLISINDVVCAGAFASGTTGQAVVTFVGSMNDVSSVTNWVNEHGLEINLEVSLYPDGYFPETNTPSIAPTIASTSAEVLSCGDDEELITIDVKVGYWYDATISQLWTLSESCEHMSGYPESDFGTFTMHSKTCCLPHGIYTLTCFSGPTFGWKDGNVQINGEEYCNIDDPNTEETHEINLCPNGSSCGQAPPDFFELTEECDGGFVPQVSMAIGTATSAANDLSWKLTDACQGGNYEPLDSFGVHEYHPADCCLPKGKYTLTCTSGIFSWQTSFLLINGRQYCFGADGEESHTIDLCGGSESCPDFTTAEGSTNDNGIVITVDNGEAILSGQISDAEQHNDSCFFAENGECDVDGLFPLCHEGTDCTDCGDCEMIYAEPSSAWVWATSAAISLTLLIFF